MFTHLTRSTLCCTILIAAWLFPTSKLYLALFLFSFSNMLHTLCRGWFILLSSSQVAPQLLYLSVCFSCHIKLPLCCRQLHTHLCEAVRKSSRIRLNFTRVSHVASVINLNNAFIVYSECYFFPHFILLHFILFCEVL